MPIGSQRLTENQWKALISEWENLIRQCGSSGKINGKRKRFVEDWCRRNDAPVPHPSSVTRRLQHKKGHDTGKEEREVRFFPLCRCTVECELIAKVKEIYGDEYKHDGYNEDLCINCNTKRFIEQRDHAADVFIEKHMHAKKGPVIDWPDAIAIPAKTIPLNKPPGELLTCPSFLHFSTQPIRVRTIALPDNKPSAMWESRICGGKHPQSFNYAPWQVAENPGDGSIGLLLFGRGDFAMVDTSTISNETIYNLSQGETASILEMETGRRQGAAGGRFHFSDNRDHDVQSLTPATKQTRAFIVKDGSKSTKLELVYINYANGGKRPEAKVFHSVYNDVLMKRLSSQEKRDATKQCPHLREKYIAEMKSRLRCFLIMDHFNLSNPHCWHWKTFLSALGRTGSTQVREWRKVDPSLPFFDCVLLEWCCGTGEMRNHEALSVHVDANKSHPVESMQAFGRLNPAHSHLGKTRQVSFFRDAILCALWEMVALKVRCGRDIWHLSLANTYHVPDRDRGGHNTTWLHGP